MIVTETIFVSSKPVGVVRRDDYSGEIAFSPQKPPSKLPLREWKSVDELKAAVLEAYTNENPPD